jgi:voltage-gated potassium channel Kch
MSATANLLLTLAGAGLLVLVFYDIYATILRATKYPGPFSEMLNRSIWWLVTQLTRKLSRRFRHRILSAAGPLLMPLLIALLLLTLMTGFALIYLPRLETDFQMIEAAHGSLFLRAIYFSGITLMTVGYGDILPLSGAMRVTALLEAALGMATISISITYLLTVYSALERKRAVALKFYHQARQGADISGYITSHFARGQFHSLTESLREATHDLQEMLESHIEHPVIHYFHPVEVYKGLPRALFVVLESVAILNAHLDEKEYVEAGDHPNVLIAGDSARHVLFELVMSLKLETRVTKPFETEEETLKRRRKSFNRAARNLERSRIKVRTDIEQAFLEYTTDRSEWERQLYHFADFLGYDWDEVTGDRSLEDATDNEITERHEMLAVEKE